MNFYETFFLYEKKLSSSLAFPQSFCIYSFFLILQFLFGQQHKKASTSELLWVKSCFYENKRWERIWKWKSLWMLTSRWNLLSVFWGIIKIKFRLNCMCMLLVEFVKFLNLSVLWREYKDLKSFTEFLMMTFNIFWWNWVSNERKAYFSSINPQISWSDLLKKHSIPFEIPFLIWLFL